MPTRDILCGMKQIAGFLILALAIAGCNSSGGSAAAPPAQVKTSAIPNGWKVAKGGGVSIALPGDWVAVDVSRPDVSQAVEHLGVKGQEGEMLKQQIRTFASMGMFKIVGFAPLKQGVFQSNVNINIMPIPTADMNEMLKENKAQLAKAGNVIESGIVENPKRAVLIAEMEYPTPSGAPVKYVTQGHLFIRGTEQITITFSSAPEAQAEMKKLADQAIQTFAYEPPKVETP